jgi:hypothetical protein
MLVLVGTLRLLLWVRALGCLQAVGVGRSGVGNVPRSDICFLCVFNLIDLCTLFAMFTSFFCYRSSSPYTCHVHCLRDTRRQWTQALHIREFGRRETRQSWCLERVRNVCR